MNSSTNTEQSVFEMEVEAQNENVRSCKQFIIFLLVIAFVVVIFCIL
jgi:hypothetical protein